MGVFPDEAFYYALKLALAARMLSPLTPSTSPGQVPVTFIAPSACYDFMNPTTTKPFTTIFNPYPSIPGSTKTSRPPYVIIPSYTIVPLHALQTLAPPPHPTTPLYPPDSAFRNVVERAVEHSIHGAAALAWLLSEIAKATPQKDLAPHRDDEQLSSCDSLDMSSLPSLPAEDDLLRVDMTELELISSSELYPREEEEGITVLTAPRPSSSKSKSSPRSRSSSSITSLDTILEDYLPDEDLSGLRQIPNDELYLDLEDLAEPDAPPPWPFKSSPFIISR